MAYDNDQKEPALPGGNNSIRRKSENHLPRYFRTSFNSKFLSSTLDQLIQPGVAEKLNGYIGRKATKAFLPSDNYVGAVSKSREDYQLEPAAVIKDNLNNIDFYKDYNDYVNTIKFLGGNTDNHSNLNAQEFYTWNPNIDWDKFTNYREYYWLPAGPELLTVTGQAKGVTSTYTVELNDNVDNLTYIFNPDGQTNNPTLKLYRGQTYRFEINTPSYPIAFATKKSFTPGEAVIVETSDGIRSDGVFDAALYDQDGTVYDAGGFIKDPVSQEEALASLQFGDAVNSSLIYETGITKTDADGNTISNVFIEKGIIEFTIPDTAPDKLYYISKTDPNVSGFIRIFDIDENTFLDVEKDIIGKKSYTTADGWTFSNGMKLEFAGEITPAKYASGQWYVEGVGDKIRLVSQDDLTVSGLFTDDIVVPFDDQEFDFFPFSEALGYPVNKDYIVINRASNDGNLWSRYNRWFHKDVIEETSRILGTNISIDESSRAKRPIIEFDPNIKLYNFGTRTKADVDLVDTFTKDIFTTIEGSEGYNIDGVNLTNGMRVLFTADEDLLVSGKIYTVRFIKFKNKTQISLVEDTDSAPLENETVLVKFGTQYSGQFFFYNGTQWKQGQRKTKVNQQPLFELYDDTGKSFADTTVYNSTTFSGNNIFSYKVGTGATDSELGFPLTYRSIENVGDIVYEFNLLQDSFTYQIGTEIFAKTTDTGYLRKYTDRTAFSYINGWTTSDNLSTQNVIRQYIFDDTTSNFYIDVYDNNDFINDLWIRVYINNKLLNQDVDFTINQDANNRSYISFIQDLNLDDVILIKTRSKYPKNENGYYEIPTNLEKNPLNENLNEFTLGEVNDHVASIVEEINNFSGIFPGPSNLRDLGQLNIYGRKFLKHSGPINLSLYHLISDESNVVKALRFAKREYGKFKRQFLEVANTLGYEGPTKQHVDLILKEMNKDKTSSMPFYFSDMIPQGGFTTTAFEIEDIDEQFFALSQIFSLDELSRKAVQVYQNGIQLVHGLDYTFNSEGFAVVTSTKSIGDIIEIYEYDSTNGSFMPPTPTKLGLYPAYIPKIYNDSTTSNNIKVIEGHDGSKFVAFDDFRDNLLLELEKRIYNNIKIKYDPTLVDIHDFLSGDYRDTGFSKQQIDNPMTKDFLQWNQLVDGDYVTNTTFARNNPFTWNYSNATSYAGGTLPGYWRQAYLRAYDTDRPHTNPWEMLGFSVKPTWWETQYGPAPYTRNNKLLWDDLRDGIVREPNKPIVVHPKYVRPNLYSILPVNDEGELLDPNASGVAVSFNPGDIPSNWKYGDGGPIESAWRRSSEYPFSVFISWILNQPNSIFSTGFDRQRQRRNLANQIVYSDTGIQTKLSNLIFPNTIEDTEQVFTSGLVNYVANYMTSNTTSSYTQYKSNLKSITNQIGAKIAGYSDKDKFRLILDSRTPTNEGNVFIPTENYQLILNTSSPIETVNYSGVIVEKLINGYSISGYDDTNPSFTYYKPIKQKNDPVIDIGGVSEPFVNFAERKTYATGQIVLDNGSYYRAKETHTSETTIDTDKFVRLPALPTVGGRRATFSKIYENKKTVLNYGSVFSTIQEVVDFLLGYGQYLVTQGFVFEDRIENSNVVNDWNTTAKQFMFWTTQNWGAGALLTVSPGASKIILNTEFSVVDDIFHNFYGYSVLKADGKKLEPEFLRIEKGVDNKCTVRVVNTADGIYNIRLPLVQKEHVVLLDNKTVFDDIIYDAAPGYRQERIKVLGYRTDNWNGSLNIPGFIYDNARPTEWEAWKDYSIGDLVKYKEFFYSADKKVSGKEFFDSDDWNRLAKEPIPGLLTNFDYKINQFADFYDLDSDNFDTEQQRLAQHLIGYQKRQYLENIINDDVSQYKFYQGFILDKGTKNALNKLFDALASANQDSLSFYEEWAVKDGQYGASEGFEEVEYTLDENKFRLDPQPVLLTNEGQQETDLVYRIKEYETYLKSNNYDHSPFPTTYINKGYTKDAGFVNPEHVDITVGLYDDILDLNFVDIKNQGYVWVQNYNKTWTVLQHTISDYSIESITPGSNEFTVKVDKTPLDINTGDILGITDVTVTSFNPAGPDDSTLLLSQTTDPLEGFFKVKSVSLNNIVFESTNSVNEIEKCSGLITKLISVRQEDINSANILAEQEISKNEKIWIDDAGNGKWAVLENKNSFDTLQEISNTETGTGHNYGATIAADDRNVIMAVGAPNNEDGKVFVYNRASNSLNYQLQQVLEPTENISAAKQKFGFSVSLSGDGKYLIVGAPEASNVKTDFRETFNDTTNYDAGDIVRLNNSLWQADIDILGAVTNIQFSSFDSVAQINYDLNLIGQNSEKIPVLLSGDYPFKNVTTDHFLVRAPKDMYQGSGVDDKLFFRWNSFANANQTQINLTSLAPFAGEVPHIDKQFIESAHTIFYKVDAILFVDASNNIPLIGDTVTTAGATGTVVYTHNEEAQVTIYVNDVNGDFPRENSLFINGNDFVGEYQRVGPGEETDTSQKYGGYWFIKTGENYQVGETNSDPALGLVYTDIISEISGGDSTSSGNYYYQSLDYQTNVQSSENVLNNFIQTLSFQGSPGPFGNADPILSRKFVVRVPADLSSDPAVTIGSEVNLYINNLPDTTTTISFTDPVDLVANEVLVQDNTGASVRVLETVTNRLTVTVDSVVGNFNTADLLSGSSSGALGVRPTTVPVVGFLDDPNSIGLSFSQTNTTQTVVDVWDGYISYRNTKFLNGEPFEPLVGQTVRDVSTLATAEVVYYQRSLNDVTIWVKNVSGNWSNGNQFGDNAEIEFLPFPSGPDPDVYGRPGIYTVPRVIGQIQRISLGLPSAGIGKLFVFETASNIPLVAGDFRTASQLGGTPVINPATGTFSYFESNNNFEYWLYKEGTVLGIAREANTPNASNLDWTEIYVVPTSTGGSPSSFDKEGIYYVYQKNTGGRFELINSYISPDRDSLQYFGTKVSVNKTANNLYRGFINAPGQQNLLNPGKIYFIKNGTENNITYNWEYAKNKKFKGEFDNTQGYFVGDIVYLGNRLYNAATNINPGPFNNLEWDSTDDLIDYIGYVPNDTGLTVVTDSSYTVENPYDPTQLQPGDSTVLDQSNLVEFGSQYDVSKNGEVLVVSAKYSDKPNLAVVYRNVQGQFVWSQQISSPTITEAYGDQIAISNDGKLLAVSAPSDDTTKNNQGKIYIYTQVDGEFVFSQLLNSPLNNTFEFFGNRIDFDGNRLLVNAKNGDNKEFVTFDIHSDILEGRVLDKTSKLNDSATTFDQGFTNFSQEFEDQGSAYIYENISGKLIYAQSLKYQPQGEDNPLYSFGRNIHLKNNHAYVGLPKVSSNTLYVGTVVDFRLPDNKNVYEYLSLPKDPVDVQKIKRAILYNTKTNNLLTYLDYIDPIQGKVAGVAEENLRYKTYYDPAVYSVGNSDSVVVNPVNSWGPNQVGQLWWNLTNAKFLNPYQSNVIYSANNWNTLAQGSSVDVYEWVESTVLPSVWDASVDQDESNAAGIDGTSVYGDAIYSTRQVYDDVSQSLQTKYYFWVRNKRTLPDKEFRTLSSQAVANLIEDPKGQGYRYATLISDNSFAVYNCDNLLEGKDVAIGIQYWTIDNQNINIHNQYQIITEELETSRPNRDIERKWFDSLVGYDQQGRQVPAPDLSPKVKYGILNSPRQSWFENKSEALKQLIERVNGVLKTNLIVDNKDFTRLLARDPEPSLASRRYDTTANTVADLEFIGVAKAQQATMTLQITDGVITKVNVLNPGRGYLQAPTYKITGTGSGAELEFSINNLGVITNVNVLKGGSNYSDTDIITIRKYTVLVENDETIQGKWALYERDSERRIWQRIASQAFDTSLYWDYIDWYANGFNQFTETNFVIDNAYELQGLEDSLGDVIKINNIGSGGWLLLRKIDVQDDVDYTVNYETIGRQNGTIKFKSTLYDTRASAVGFDIVSFDSQFYDSVPSTEIRNILTSIKEDLYTEELSIEYNRLFFASLRYVFSEQNYVDWAFKTSFVKARHNVGELREDITFNNDSLPSYEKYLEEVKPFKTKLREYVSAYEKTEDTNSRITDFDLQPSFNNDTNQIQPQNVKLIDNNLIGINDKLNSYPYKNWTDNVGFKVTSIEIADGGQGYQVAPTIRLSGGGGTGASALAKLGANGRISKIEVTSQGAGYLSAPTIEIVGSINEGGRAAKASVIIGESLPRSITNKIKYDRVSGVDFITTLNETETFIGTGSKYIFDLKWPMDLKNINVEVFVNNILLLRSEYKFSNQKDTTKGYTRYKGRIELTEPATNGVSIVVNYKKDINLLTAADRINLAYDPQTGQFAKDLGQLMDGVDYGGVEVKSFDFGGPNGWDTGPWFTSEYDTYDTTYEDIIFNLDGSTIQIELEQPLEDGVIYNLYKNGVRLDDPDWTDDSSQFTNPNAIMRSIEGDGVQTVIELDELGVPTKADDVIIIRKSTSDGSFLPIPGSYDTLLTGGDLNYTNAQGINAEAINIDGDGFFTPVNSGGPDEQLPGRIFDAVDIKVYEKPVGGSSQIVSRNYTGDGTTKLFDIGTSPIVETNLFVKVDYSIQKAGTDYTVNYDTKQIEFTTAPGQGNRISLVTLETSGTNILDIDEFISDGSSIDFLTNITYTENLSSLVTIDGKEIPHSLVESNETYASPNKIIIRFAEVPTIDKIVRFAIFEGQVQNYSTVTVDTFESDGSTTAYTLSQIPFAQAPNEWQTIVTINDTVLNAGYNQTFTLTDAKEYQLKLWQVPTASLSAEQVKVYLNGTELTYIQQWTFSSAESFDITQPLSSQVGSSVTLANDVGVAGDTLKVYILGWDDSTQSGGDYRYGFFDNQGEFVSTPGTLYINKNYSVGDIIKVYQFSNHDSQGIDRQSFDVVERTLLNQGVNRGTQSFEIDGSTSTLNLLPALTARKYYAVYLNNIRIDDPNYGTSNPVTNPNAIMKTIFGAEQTAIDIQVLGISVSAGDLIQIVEIGGDIIPDAGTADWYELRQLRNGYINLRSEAVDDQYVWVMKNGSLLTPSVDYHVTPDRLRVKLLETLTENDTVETFHFANSQLKNKFGWRQFKDILNRNIYKRLDGSKNFILADTLYWYDKEINVVDATLLPDPVPGSKYPAIIFIDGERIEYFRKDGNKLKQLRRGTLGTGVKEMYAAGIEIYDQSATATVPYKDETLSTIFTADGTSNIYELDFTPEKPYYGEIVDTFEVFVAGRRLRKNAVSSYQLDTDLRDTYAAADQTINQDSPEGDITLPAEFSIQNGNELVLLDTPLENQKVIIVRNQGKTWTEPGQRLADASSNIAKFLQAVQVDLPG